MLREPRLHDLEGTVNRQFLETPPDQTHRERFDLPVVLRTEERRQAENRVPDSVHVGELPHGRDILLLTGKPSTGRPS